MRVVISAGPTREAIDPVRFITNRSTGKMAMHLQRPPLRADSKPFLSRVPSP